jgi:hypothetical protein
VPLHTHLIVFYLLSGHRRITQHGDFCNEIMFCLPVCVVHYGHGIAIPNWLPCGLPVKYAVKYALGAPEEKEDKDKESVCFITAGPITKLCAWGEEESGGHVL